MNVFLKQLDEYRQRSELKDQHSVDSEQRVKFKISAKAKMIKRAFKTILLRPTIDILSDGDDQVAIEGVSILTEYYYLFPKSAFDDEYKPRIEDIFKNAIDNRICVSQ